MARFIVLTLAATVVLHLLRSGLSWWITDRMGCISQEWIAAMRGASHRKLM